MKTKALTRTLHYRSAFRKSLFSILSNLEKGCLKLTIEGEQEFVFGNIHEHPVCITVIDERFFDDCFLYGDIGFGEAYTKGFWTSDDVTSVIRFFIENLKEIPGISGSSVKRFAFNVLRSYNRLIHLLRANTIDGSRKNISSHYDLSNDFFKIFLDETMTYSSAMFTSDSMTLEDAQHAKYLRLWEKLGLSQDDHVLEIGCGWGYNAVEMAKRYGCKVTAVTISEEQFKVANERVINEALEDKVDIQLIDYRNLTGHYSKIISIEMLEAVGHQYYNAYFRKLSELMLPGAVAAFQVITCPDSRYHELRKGTDWIQKHIFPGTLLPSVGILNKAIASNTELTLVDLKDLGMHYAKTLHTWRVKFNGNLSGVQSLGFDEAFIRKWNYYLCYCEAAFATRNIHVMQMIYSTPNNPAYT